MHRGTAIARGVAGDLTMMRLLALSLPLFLLGCRGPEPVAAAAPTPKAHMNMLQLMRAFPFPHSNVLFDTQSRDPIGPEKKQSMVFSVYRWGDSDTYACLLYTSDAADE